MTKAETIVSEAVVNPDEAKAAPASDTVGIRGTVSAVNASWLVDAAKKTKQDQGLLLDAALNTLRGLSKEDLQAALLEVITARMWS